MPTYLYRSKKPGCDACASGFTSFQPFSADPHARCQCGAPIYRAIQPVKCKIKHTLKGDCRDYRDDLARGPGDPEAWVDGPRSLQKLIDKRKREGWEITKGFDTPAAAEFKDPGQVAREAYTRAKRKGFIPDKEA